MFNFRERLARFGRSERGTVMAEAVLVLPFMLWAYWACSSIGMRSVR